MTTTTTDTAMSPESLERIPWVEPAHHSFDKVTETISNVCEQPQPRWWWPMFAVAFTMMVTGVLAATYLISTGVGVWGSNNTVAWAFDITNFVFWIGIGHAGTLISAILFLFRQKWRTSINRFSEAMTLFAVICAGVYPGIHVGRFWYAWFMFPLPNANHIWQNFRSALSWDLFAVGTYFTVSVLFWYVGLIPDLATLRDRAKTAFRKKIFGLLSFGWRGSIRNWRHYEIAYLLLAGFSTPLVLSVHSVVSFDFATSVVPGWHTTIFPPYFVAGAIFGGFAMVLQCMIPVRMMYPGLKDIVTTRHMDVMAKFILATGTLVGYAYAMEFFIAWYSGNPYESAIFINRATGNYWWAYWLMLSSNLFIPQLLWMKSWRTTPWKLLIVATIVNMGMWWERFVIIVQSLHRDYLPSSWADFIPSWVDWAQMIGDFGLFFTLTLLFIRFLPMIAMSEIKGVLPQAHPHHNPTPTLPPSGEGGRRQNPSPGPSPKAGGGSTVEDDVNENARLRSGQRDAVDPPPALGEGPGEGFCLHPINGGTEGGSTTTPHIGAKVLESGPLVTPVEGSSGNTWGVVAEFHGPGALKQAAETLRDRGYTTLDAYTPYPVHGMVRAIGMTRSGLPWITICGSILGLGTALFMQFYLMGWYYPTIVQGKQFTSWEAFVPICFELMVLFSAFFTVFGMLGLCGLPRYFHPIDQYNPLQRATNEGFFLSIEVRDPKYSAAVVAELEQLGGYHVAVIPD